jgi:hypothetical protein
VPPWGRAIAPEEIAALVSHIRSQQGTTPANPKTPEGNRLQRNRCPGNEKATAVATELSPLAQEKAQDATPPAKAGHGPFHVAPEEDLLYSMAPDGSRKWMDPIVIKGRFWWIRVAIG